jgi:hypothetical protein
MSMSMIVAASLLVPLGYWVLLELVNGRARTGEPPLVTGVWPFVGVALAFGRDATRFIMSCRARHGEVFTLYLGGRRMTFVLDPMSYPTVLKARQLSFRPIADAVMATAFQSPNYRARVDVDALEELSKSELKGEALARMTTTMAERLEVLVDALATDDWQQKPLYRTIWDAMFHAGTDAVFGRGPVNRELADAFERFDRAFPLMVANLPRVLYRDADAALAELGASTKLGEHPSAWVARREPYFAELDAVERGHVHISVLWAIHANSIPATFWSLFYLLRDPTALAAVQSEIDTVDGPVHEALDRMRMLDSAIREALRLSSGSMTVREVLEPFELETESGTFALRQGDQVCLAPFITHRDAEIFDEPERYRHDRFWCEHGVKSFYRRGERVPLPLMPFGAGASMCPGRYFAINEIKLFIALLLRESEIELLDERVPEFELGRAGLGIYPPNTDVAARIRRRVSYEVGVD